MEVKGKLPSPVQSSLRSKSRFKATVVLFGGALFTWLICTQVLDIRIQLRKWRFMYNEQPGYPQLNGRSCSPFLPSSLLQLYPPSSSDWEFKAPIQYFNQRVTQHAAQSSVDSIMAGIVSTGGLIWSNGFGRAKANGTERVPPNEHTIYRIASISKLFATMEGFILKDKGIIQWDDPVRKHLPSFTHNTQSWKEFLKYNQSDETRTHRESDPITLHQLAAHISGIGKLPASNLDWYPIHPPKNFSVYWPSVKEQLGNISEYPLISDPFNFPVYSNTGFSLLGASLSAADSSATENETTYTQIIERDILAPLNMNGSSFGVSDQNRLHLAIPRDGSEIDFVGPDSFPATGGQYSSLSDLSKAAQSLFNPGNHSLLTPSSHYEWFRPIYSFPDSYSETGLVWEIQKYPDTYRRDQRYYGKRGDLEWSHSIMMINPDLQYGIIVLMNGISSVDTSIISEEAVRLFQPAFERLLEKRARERYAGVWHGKGNDIIDLEVRSGSLWITKWVIDGFDFLKFYQAQFGYGIALWSTGRFDEFRVAIGHPGVNFGCLPMWMVMDMAHSLHTPVDLLYFEEDGDELVLRFPSVAVTMRRWI